MEKYIHQTSLSLYLVFALLALVAAGFWLDKTIKEDKKLVNDDAWYAEASQIIFADDKGKEKKSAEYALRRRVSFEAAVVGLLLCLGAVSVHGHMKHM